MKADFTRNTFDQFQHFDRVLSQQGRVQLDADWNEQAAILLHYLRTLAEDLIGPQGGPSSNWGFGITTIGPASGVPNNFRIGPGRYYVDGILCEADTQPVGFTLVPNSTNQIQVDRWTADGVPFQLNQWVEVLGPSAAAQVSQIINVDQAHLILTLQPSLPANTPPATVRRVCTYTTQPDYPTSTLAPSKTYLIYLDVWERLITYIEDDRIREVALGGPDTAARAKVIWQVKAVPGKPGNSPDPDASPCDNFQPDPSVLANLSRVYRGRLKARAKQTSASTDPCIIPPNASYTGPENQLYRVEIHRGGGAWSNTSAGISTSATFKWSRENGAVVFPVVSVASGSGVTTVVLENLGRDDRFGLSEGQWVEIQDDTSVLQNRAETMLQVQSIDRPSLTVTLSGASTSGVGMDPAQHPLLRRWDYEAGDPADGELQLGSDNAALVIEVSGGAWLSLENGVQIQFQPPGPGRPPAQYRTGDYWLIPARTATGDVEWPSEAEKDAQNNTVIVPLAKPPDGVDHHYAPLGIVNVDVNGVMTPSDCRKQFPPTAK
jgi:hypothetical protein